MGYDAYARHILGIQVTRDQFLKLGDNPTFKCGIGHIQKEPAPNYCPDCGEPVREDLNETPTPELVTWLGDGTEEEDADYIWEELTNKDGIGVHNADQKTCNADNTPPDIWAFGKLLGYKGSDQQGGGETGFTISELQAHADEITAEAAKLGITGEVKLYLQLYESI